MPHSLSYDCFMKQKHTKFPLPGWQNMIFLVPPASFLRPKMHQNCWRPGLRPGPRSGAHDAPPDHLIGWEGGKPIPRLIHHRRLRRLNSRAFGASIRASDKCPSKQNCGYATEWVVIGERQLLSLPRAAKLQNPPLIKYMWMREKDT
jgi:hypothetical protein